VVQDVDTTAEERQEILAGLDDYMDVQIDHYIANPRDDLTSFLLTAEIDDSKLAREHIRGTMILLMIGGIDATWSALTRRSRWRAWSLRSSTSTDIS
jgi:cytochrome P450